MYINNIKNFFKTEAGAGVLLGITALLAIIIANTPFKVLYNYLLSTPVVIRVGALEINKPLLLWINDGLMAVFFLLVGLEIKREIVEGQLSTKEQISLPLVAAAGGLACPALIYYYCNAGNEIYLKGWAIPAATDIAFAIGVMALLGKNVPKTLKICLVAIAIIDDLAAIIIIAIFYTKSLSLTSLAIASVAIFALYYMNSRNITSRAPYVVAGLFLWVCVLKSGVHATLAGVVIALFIPLKSKNEDGKSPSKSLEHDLHPWVSYFILPIFAFANAGVSLSGLSMEMVSHPITLGITAGLFIGKQAGVMIATVLCVMIGFCKLPKGVNWSQYYAMSLITGIGFTMSLFIGTLAFNDPQNQTFVRLGVILGSLLSGIIGYALLRVSCKK
ncbi:MAG: Na+/H+ antiporter NhaA [Rickettsiales bacterium]|nr:Na+/H+ antiporter NhaA [Rickettsiales bacterium]